MAGWTIRAMEPGDLPRCAAIEATAPDPWTEPQLAEELASDFGRLFVACRDGQTAGLAVFQLAAGEASLNALTVGLGEIICCSVLGVGLVKLIETNPALREFFH